MYKYFPLLHTGGCVNLKNKGIKTQLFGITVMLIANFLYELNGIGFKNELISLVIFIVGFLISIFGLLKKD